MGEFSSMESLERLVFAKAYSGKRVLITGHTGFKGSWLTQWLLDLGAVVCGYSIDIPTKPSHFELLNLDKKIDHQLGDVRDFSNLKKTFDRFKPEIVFHLAAQPLVRASYDDPRGTFETNVMGTVNLFECVRLSQTVVATVSIATDKCYENLETGQAYQEDDKLGGADPYSASKACAEIAFTAYQKSFFSRNKMRVGTARAGNVIGGSDWAADRIIPDCVRAWTKGEAVVTRSPKAIRPWQHVLEPLGGYLLLGAKLLNKDYLVIGESFNFGPANESSRTVEDLLAELTINWPAAKWTVDESAVGNKKESKVLKLSCEKASKLLNWRAQMKFEEAVSLTSEWYRQFNLDSKKAADLTRSQIQSFQERLLRSLS